MDRSKKFSVYSMLIIFGFIVFTNIGGCGGGGGNGSNDNEDIDEIPEFSCQSPPLNTDFSDRGVFFVDTENSILVGITSDGEFIQLVLTDIPDSGARQGLIGEVLSETSCDVILGTFDFDMDFQFNDEILLLTEGKCSLFEDFSIIFIEDLEIAGLPLGFDIEGECDEVIFFDDVTKDLDSANEIMTRKSGVGTTRKLDGMERIYQFQEVIDIPLK